MLEVKNLFKQYKGKGGVVTNALNDVSIVFPETGMIFLLGKSGSGKSTLLNVIGGLDKPDKGEIIIKGKNSKDFSAADFDSYRNTFIGFVFQEYNILNEFNVEQNISLALQLQGKPNDKAAVDDILIQVDLEGLGKRKPNTLSGGQKQRVAIARALIKNPEIIMADEPTGALDSNTGKQVFDTLKKLSEKKLVIVVSHDRDFAEFYGDRIIELSDGKVISDVSKEYVKAKKATENVNWVNNNTLTIKDASKLDKADMDAIFKSLKDVKGEVIISSGERDVPVVRQAIHINSDNSSEVFNDTKDVQTKEYNGNETKFIRSHLPFSRAFKMGSSSLKTKPIRLIFTSFLTIVALTMFGLTSTLMLFRESYTLSKSLQKSDRVSEMVRKEYSYTRNTYRKNNYTNEEELMYSYDDNYQQTMFSQEDINSMNSNSNNLYFSGVYQFLNEDFNDLGGLDLSDDYYRKRNLQGFVEINNEFINKNGFELVAGNLPSTSDEIVISEYMFDVIKGKYNITSLNSIIGKTYSIKLGNIEKSTTYPFKVSGVLSVGKIPEKYDVLKNEDTSISNEQKEQLKASLDDLLENSYHTMVYVNSSFYNDYYYPIMGNFDIYNYSYGSNVPRQEIRGFIYDQNQYWHDDWWDSKQLEWEGRSATFFEDIKEKQTGITFYDLDGNPTSLVDTMADKDVYCAYYMFKEKQREAYNSLFDKVRNLAYDRQFDSDFYELVKTEEGFNNYQNIINRLQSNYFDEYYPDEYDKDTDFKYFTNVKDNYYEKIMSRKYTIEIAGNYVDKYQLLHDWNDESYSTSFNNFKTAFEEIINSGEPYNLTKYNVLTSYLSEDEANLMRYINIWYFFDKSDLWDYYQLMDDFNNNFNETRSVPDTLVEQIENLIENKFPDYKQTYSVDWSYFLPTLNIRKNHLYYISSKAGEGELNIIGYVEGNVDFVMSKDFAMKVGQLDDYSWHYEDISEYKASGNNKYASVITKTDYSQNQIDFLRGKHNSYRYFFNNNVASSVDNIVSLISMLKLVFLIVGLTCGVFAALMLLNFIASSITSKIKEIGILRAVGARGSDLFKIFFSESGLITTICLVISLVASIVTCIILNNYMAKEVGIAILNFGIINIALMVVGGIVIAFLGTFIPVLIASKKPPVDSIRTL